MSFSDLLNHLSANKDAYDVILKVIAVPAGLFAFVRYLLELTWSRRLRREELDWRRSQKAHELISAMYASRRDQDAMRMLDYDGRVVEIDDDSAVPISYEMHRHALRTTNTNFTNAEVYIRDCFDHILSSFSGFEHYIRRNLIAFEDVRYPTEYYASLMARARPIYEAYARSYGMDDAIAFMDRFDVWRRAPTVGNVHDGAPGRVASSIIVSEQSGEREPPMTRALKS